MRAIVDRYWRGSVAIGLLVLSGALTPLSCGASAPMVLYDRSPDAGADAAVDRPASVGDVADGTTGVDAAGDHSAPTGATCAGSGDCAGGHCFDGVCCDQDCAEACHSCALPGSVGTCLLVDVGSDPRNDCVDQGSPSCGNDGTCDGNGACRKYPTGIVCKPPSCAGSTLTLAFRCAGGACSPTSGQPCDPYVCGTAASCGNTCTKDQDCTPPNACANGVCGKPPLGGACAHNEDCNSGICQQNVCCSTTCTGPCRSCALKGSEGSCTNIPERQDPLDQCSDTGAASCGTDGSCDGAGACHTYQRGTTCRAAAGVCDLAETCAGGGVACPADGFTVGTICRASTGLCDLAETCSGGGPTCPADGFVPGGTICRAAAGSCDSPERCAGNGPACPPDVLVAAGTTCRASGGMCDLAETCSGGAAACPPDVFMAAGTSCRASAGICDLPESCSGAAAACPPDALVPAGTLCRGPVDLCDAAESCDGSTAACPPDLPSPARTTCRAIAGSCDVAETCDGTSMACPPDAFMAAGTTCRAVAGVCDLAESCSGGGPACPPDAVLGAGVPCRPSLGGCDAVEVCDGALGVCPPDLPALPPVAPNLAVTRGNTQAILTWPAVPGAIRYTVKRGMSAAGPFTTLGTTPATIFTSTGLTNGVLAFFVVSATSSLDSVCVSADSPVVAVIPNPCPGIYCDDFEADTLGTQANGWLRIGGSAGDWSVVDDGSQFFAQNGAVSATLRAAFASGAPGAPWSGPISVSADVKITAMGLTGPAAAMVCPRFIDLSNFYCMALGPGGIQIQTRVNGNALNSAIFSQSINTGSVNQVKLSLNAAGQLSVTLNSSVRGTLTPPPLPNGFAAVATTSLEAEFDTVVVTQP
jgi:hypothetical protein